jgi:hypothetical protein
MISETDHELTLEALDQVNGGGLLFTAEQIQAAINATKPGNWSHYHGIISRFSSGQKSF